MDYYFKPSSLRDLRKLPKEDQERILKKLDFFVQSNEPLKFAEPIKNKILGEFRFRIGEYRVIFDFDSKQNIIIVLAVGHRKDIYR